MTEPSAREFRRYTIAFVVAAVAVIVVKMAAVQGVAALSSDYVSARWYRDLPGRKRAAAAAIPGRRIFVVGGSGVHFSVRAERLGKELQADVVNYGLFADMSLPLLLREVEAAARPGDTMVLALEYEHYRYQPGTPDDGLVIYYLFANAHVPRLLGPLRGATLLLSVPFSTAWHAYQTKRGLRDPNENNAEFRAETVNAFGDETEYPMTRRVAARQSRLSRLSTPLVEGVPPNGAAWAELHRFIARCREKKIGLVASFPALARNARYASLELRLVDQLRRFYAAEGVPLLGTVEASLFDVSLFYDTEYHMNQAGREVWTRRLADEMRRLKLALVP